MLKIVNNQTAEVLSTVWLFSRAFHICHTACLFGKLFVLVIGYIETYYAVTLVHRIVLN